MRTGPTPSPSQKSFGFGKRRNTSSTYQPRRSWAGARPKEKIRLENYL